MAGTELEPSRSAVSARARWDATPLEERRRATEAATAARGRVAEVQQTVAQLEARFAAELDALRAEIADLRQRRIAA